MRLDATSVLAYATAVWRHWFALVVAGVGAVLGFVDLGVGGEHSLIPIWTWLVLILVGLVIAQYLAWLDMRGERDHLADAASASSAPVVRLSTTGLQTHGGTGLQLKCLNQGDSPLNNLTARILEIARWDEPSSTWIRFEDNDADHFPWDGPGIRAQLNPGSEILLNVASAERVGASPPGHIFRNRITPN